MNSTALIISGLGLHKKADALAKKGKLMRSICAVTGLSFDEVVEKTKGQHLELILKAAAISGECMEYEAAARYVMCKSITALKQVVRLAIYRAYEMARRRGQILPAHFWRMLFLLDRG